MDPRDPWAHAEKNGRCYLTPEDVADAIDAGADYVSVYRAVLMAVERRAAEDAGLCAYIALEWDEADAHVEARRDALRMLGKET